jgi:hypothetical protein
MSQQQRVPTPPGVQVHTPQPSPRLTNVRHPGALSTITVSPKAINETFSSIAEDTTPWHNFLKWVNASSSAISIITPVSARLDQARAGMPHDTQTSHTSGMLSTSPIDAVLITSDLDIARPAQSLRGLSSFLPLNTQD